jgi:FkbM family methyltransferase
MATSLAAPPSFLLPNGQEVYGLNFKDTLMVYRDIFEDDCYRRHGVTIEDGDCIFDVGANTGLFVLYLNQICARADVYAFEPLPATFQVLERNVATRNKLAVRLFNVGLSDRSGSADFVYYPRLSNASTMFPDDPARVAQQGREYVLSQIDTLPWPHNKIAHWLPSMIQNLIADQIAKHYLKQETVRCELWSLADFLRGHDIDEIDLLKLDAEHSEQLILAGLGDKDWAKIRQAVVEVHGGDAATQGIVDLFSSRGFRAIAEPNPALPTLSLVYATRPRL